MEEAAREGQEVLTYLDSPAGCKWLRRHFQPIEHSSGVFGELRDDMGGLRGYRPDWDAKRFYFTFVLTPPILLYDDADEIANLPAPG